jgi:uncharacterized RDD family membrane protein YckC
VVTQKTSATIRLPIANPIFRLFAFVVDTVVLLTVRLCLGSVPNLLAGDLAWVVLGVLDGVYFWLLHAWRGQTIGKWFAGIKVVSPLTGRPPTLAASAVRAVVRSGLPLVPGVWGVLLGLADVLPMAWTRRRLCLHDLAARTAVVALPPAERGLLRHKRERGATPVS